MNEAKAYYRSLLVALGATLGYLVTGLLYEIAPSIVEFRDGVDPLVQGTAVGGTFVLLLAITAALIMGVE